MTSFLKRQRDRRDYQLKRYMHFLAQPRRVIMPLVETDSALQNLLANQWTTPEHVVVRPPEFDFGDFPKNPW